MLGRTWLRFEGRHTTLRLEEMGQAEMPLGGEVGEVKELPLAPALGGLGD